MGLVIEGEKHAVLTDIAGAEDHYGDMDFKVAGTRAGITALQMDIKVGGISVPLMRQALEQARTRAPAHSGHHGPDAFPRRGDKMSDLRSAPLSCCRFPRTRFAT